MTNGSNDWVENGYFQGATLTGTYWSGFYNGAGYWNGDTLTVYETLVSGPSTSVGSQHTHEIKYLGDSINYWRCKTDGGYSQDFYGWAGDGRMDVGFEVNNSGSTLNAQTNVDSLKWYEKGSWYSWNSSATTRVTDPYGVGISVSFVSPGSTSATWLP